MMRAWIVPTLLVLRGSAVVTGLVFGGSGGAATALLPVFVVLAGVNSPLIFPRSISTLAARRRSAVDGRPVVLWRPGCTYCVRLRIRLGRSARQLHWVEAAAHRFGSRICFRAHSHAHEPNASRPTAPSPHGRCPKPSAG